MVTNSINFLIEFIRRPSVESTAVLLKRPHITFRKEKEV